MTEDVKKEKKTNKLTVQSGLSINVNNVKSHMFAHFENLGYHKVEKGGDKTAPADPMKMPTFSGPHVAVASVLEQLCKMLCTECISHTPKDENSVREVDRRILKTIVESKIEYKAFYLHRLEYFDKTAPYADQVPVSKSELDQIVRSVDDSLKFTPRALNFLYFLIGEAYRNVISTAYLFVEHDKGSTLNGRAIVYAVRALFKDNISSELCTEITRVMKAVGKPLDAKKKEDDGVEAKNEDVDPKTEKQADDDDDDAATTPATTTPAATTPKKTAPKKQAASGTTESTEKAAGAPGKTTTPKKTAPKKTAAPTETIDDDDENALVDDTPAPASTPAKTATAGTKPTPAKKQTPGGTKKATAAA